MTIFSRLLFFLIVKSSFFMFVSCDFSGQDNFSLLKNAIEEEIQSNANDPSSFSFDNMEIADTLYYAEIVEEVLESIRENITYYENQVESEREFVDGLGDLVEDGNLTSLLESYESSLEDFKIEETTILNFKSDNETELDRVAYYQIEFSYRENNAMGALELFRKVYDVRIIDDNEVEIIWSADQETVDMFRNADTYDENWMVLVNEVFSGNGRSLILEEIGLNR